MRLLLPTVLALSFALPAHAQLAPPNAAGITYGHVHLSVKDIEVHKKLWVDHFGGVVVQKGTLTAVKLPGMLIAFRTTPPTGPSEGSVMDHFGFKVRNLAEVLKGWRDAGLPVTQEFTGAEGFPNAYLMGPDDVRIELQEDKALPVKAAVNHLHFLTPEFAKLRDWYVDIFSAVPRKRGTIETTADVPGMNLTLRDIENADRRHERPRHRPHRVRGGQSRGVRQETGSEGHQVRCRVSPGAGDWTQHRLHHRPSGHVHRAHGRV